MQFLIQREFWLAVDQLLKEDPWISNRFILSQPLGPFGPIKEFNVTDPLGEINVSGRVQMTQEGIFEQSSFNSACMSKGKLIERLEGPKKEKEEN